MLIKVLSTAFLTSGVSLSPLIIVSSELGQNYNLKVIQDINDLIIDDDFGIIEDPSESQMDTFLEQKYGIDTEQIEYKVFSYEGVRIAAKEESNDYFGSKYVTFTPKLTFNFNYVSQKIEVEAYNSTQEKSTGTEFSYKPDLGKDAFLDYFTYIEVEWRAETWNNGRKGQGGQLYHNATKHEGTNNFAEGNFEKQKFYLDSTSTTDHELYNRIYSNTNWTKAYGFFSYDWNSNEELVMEFKVEVSAYATAWNAYWAKTWSQLFVNSVIFS